MTALVLTAAAGAAASSFGITGTAASLITAGAAVAGRAIDLALLSRPTVAEGPRLDELEVTASREGAPIRRIYGRMKTGGQVIWATHLEEVRTTISTGGGKGAPQSKQVDYAYYGNFAVALGEGPLAHLGRIWVDGEELDQTSVTFRFHKGSDTQAPDPLIQAKEGPTNAPAYRGVAYVVFERLPLADYNNRIPQLTFEVYRPVGTLEAKIEGVDIIPGAGEFAYEPSLVRRTDAEGESVGENRTTSRAVSDWTASLDELQALCPNVASAALVVTWFGTDLRAGSTEIEPRVDRLDKTTAPLDWSVAGLTRQTANAVSTVAGVPAFGGTPNDASVVAAIRDLKDRGIGCVFYPFIMMDIPAGNGLSDPYGEAEQAVYPWRGRMTCDPAPGMPGTPDKTGAAAAQITSLVGTVEPGNFVLSGDTVNYSGPPEWSYRRMILHYAWLCKAAGGVDAFAIGSEFVGLTQVRSAETTYPFVDALVALAADVREILGASVRIGYAADWSEYHSHRPGDGSGDVLFNMDPLWSDPNI
ncbi:MAG: glycoside hydrolase TIM-barrel-like domain-containing protein, partial [Pseudomonadota bacterium]